MLITSVSLQKSLRQGMIPSPLVHQVTHPAVTVSYSMLQTEYSKPCAASDRRTSHLPIGGSNATPLSRDSTGRIDVADSANTSSSIALMFIMPSPRATDSADRWSRGPGARRMRKACFGRHVSASLVSNALSSKWWPNDQQYAIGSQGAFCFITGSRFRRQQSGAC